MAETIACLIDGTVQLLDGEGRAKGPLLSPYQARAEAAGLRRKSQPIVSITRGRARGELYYAIRVANGTALFAQTPGSADERQLFLGVDALIEELDFSFGDDALACTVPGPRGTSAIGSLSDDGKGVRTVTEGDVVDCMPRWAPGGRAEILYASAGIGRTQSGAWGGLSPFALHRLRFADNSVEVLTADVHFDYLAPLAISESLLYAIRRPYVAPQPASVFSAFFRAFRANSEQPQRSLTARDPRERELVCIMPRRLKVIANAVLAFDVSADGELVFARPDGVYRSKATPEGTDGEEAIAQLRGVQKLVIC